MPHRVTVLPQQRNIQAQPGETLLSVLCRAGLAPEAPCGGSGTCGKCKVLLDGREVLSCQTPVNRDMTVTLPPEPDALILTDGIANELPAEGGLCLAIDIGTTTVAAYLLENGRVLATESRKNPQASFGADVISRLQYARKGHGAELTAAIKACVTDMTAALLRKSGKTQPDTVCVVGNPAMQQLFLGMTTENLTKPPFSPLLTKAEVLEGGQVLPLWAGAELLMVPNISGYIGADTVACILATGMEHEDKLTLLVDIGTNGEMVLGNKDRLVVCATAAGPALEGAGIQHGMQAATGAIDHVDHDFSCHVMGGGNATGICGSGLLDAIAAGLHRGLINQRGRILNEEHTLPLADGIALTQEDIRQFQQAKGAIAAGIRLMADHLGVTLEDIEQVYLAGAFGTFLDPHSACRTGLIPAELEEKIRPIGNAAGSGAKKIACSRDAFTHTDHIVSKAELLELATQPAWAKCFAQSMRFDSEEDYWQAKARSLGFTHTSTLDVATLIPRQDVRDMCAADKCRAYGKNHTCPPYCGSLEDCREQLRCYSRGILVQTVGNTRKAIDTKAYRETEQRHLIQFYALADAIRAVYPNALCLGTGGCRICGTCAWPEPCRFPDKACASMEAYGLFVTQVCRDNDLQYHYGERTVTYTACVLF